MSSKMLVSVFVGVAMISCGQSDDSAETEESLTRFTATPKAVVDEVPAVSDRAEQAGAVSEEQVAIVDRGEAVYSRACVGCHLTGAAGAPRLGDKHAWAARVGRGRDALVQSAINGVPGTAMLARGSCASCSDDQIRAAVDYMLSKSQ